VKNKDSEARQPAQVRWDGACKLCAGQVEEREEGEVTEERGETSLERHVLQHESGNTPPPAAARHANPAAEGSGAGPVVAEDAERVGELGFEIQQGGGVGVIVTAAGRRSSDGGHGSHC
jgi:hypothetical protein